jgi:Polyketide cyclase / dehydrase and lipid transport
MGEFEVARSTRIAAPAQRVHGLIDDFKAWRSWSPWEDVDPALRREYSGSESGVGARYAWEGNRKAGKGDMEIVGSTPERIDVRLTFEKPWKATNAVDFTLAPAGDGATDVTWRMTGTTTGFAALFSKVVGMDRLVGKDFEKGLARMKTTAEEGAAHPA